MEDGVPLQCLGLLVATAWVGDSMNGSAGGGSWEVQQWFAVVGDAELGRCRWCIDDVIIVGVETRFEM